MKTKKDYVKLIIWSAMTLAWAEFGVASVYYRLNNPFGYLYLCISIVFALIYGCWAWVYMVDGNG